jgi:hypothetical protein
METIQPKSELFDESQSIQIIREMIQVSQKKLKNDGILFIVWGWIMFTNYLIMFLVRKIVLTYTVSKLLNYIPSVLLLSALVFTIYYIYTQRKKVKTYIGVSLRYVWVSVFVSMVLINLIQFNVLHKIYFELQHPVFMVIFAFAIVVTGGILRYRLIIIGGIAFGILAFLASYLPLSTQMLMDAGAWLIAFIIPGHILFTHRKI